MKKRETIVMCPTILRATFEWKAFLSRWSTIIKKANRSNLCIELLSGYKIYFRGEPEGKRALLGNRSDVVIDEFITFNTVKENENEKADSN